MVVFDVLSRLTSGAPVPEPAQISNFCLKLMIKMADEMPDSVLATTEAGRDYADRLRAEQTERRRQEETRKPAPETIAALAPVMDNISTSMLQRSKGEIASARTAVADARRTFAALPEVTTSSDQRERDEHLHLILGEELSLFHHAKDAEGILATQEERLALRYKISPNGREPHVVLNDILSYVADVAPLNPDRAMARLFPLFRAFPATAPDWAHAVMLSAMGSLRHANGDSVGAMDAVAEMDTALGKAGFESLDTIAPQALLDALATLLEGSREPTERTAILALLAKACAQRMQVRASTLPDPDGELARGRLLNSVFLAIQERAMMLEQAAHDAMMGDGGPPLPEAPQPVKSFDPADYADFDAKIARAADGDASVGLLAALEGYGSAFADQPMLACRAYHAAATVAHALGQTDHRRALHTAAIEAVRRAGDLSFEAEITLDIVFNDPDKAASDTSRAALRDFVGRVEAMRANFNAAYLPSNFLADKVMPYHLAIFAAAKAGDYGEMLQTMEYLKARQILGMPLSHPSTDAKRAQMRALRAGTAGQGDTDPQIALLWDEIMIARETQPITFSLDTLMARLGETVVLSYFQLETNVLIACLISRDGVAVERILTDAYPDYAEAAQSLRSMTDKSFGNTANFQRVADALLPEAFHATLLAADQIILSAHRHLHTLPLHALPMDGRALILHKPVAYVPNLSTLLIPAAASPTTERFFGAATKQSLAKDGSPLETLHAAEGEVEVLASLYPNATTLLGEDATVSGLLEDRPALAAASVVHIALHGENVAHPDLSRSPMEVYISVTDGTVDGIDIACLPLTAQLVFMSACYGGKRAASLGELDSLPGDALFGLQAAVQMAGARALLAPIWKVNDKLTPDIAERVHRAHESGASAAEALHTALVGFVDHPKRRMMEKDPSIWAPFALTAFDSSPLRGAVT